MADIESIEDFYKQKFNWMPNDLQKDIGHFNVFNTEEYTVTGKAPIKYSRRDFYKVSLIRGEHLLHYADKSFEISGTTLLFFNPLVPYKFEHVCETHSGYFCIFKEAFFTDHIRTNIRDLPMFGAGGKAAFQLDDASDKQVSDIFKKMQQEIATDYPFKYDLIRSYLMEIVHHALKMQPSESLYQYADANARITAVFTDLLERQFPIESVSQQFKLRSARDFADRLSVHVNHLNRAIRLTTGKTTTSLIFERLVSEAKALLKHTNWNIAEISYCLGFEEPGHFNHFFKKQTNTTPSSFRLPTGAR
ncbi:helix-turn-helix domain-containing protein [Mucilaginibacter sp.]|uniref:helix-turn-helix domain-containing protein n=1 Tax=Mucilaginibacter sp. TaxID=1882438 RepID=UPI003D10D6BC